MLRVMLRGASVILVGAMALTAWASPRGRVVRIERSRTVSNVIPILCELRQDMSGMCVGGTSPQIGDVVLVVDETHMIAEVRITSAQRLSQKCDTRWSVSGEILRGDMAQAQRRKSIGLIDSTLDRRGTRRIDEKNIPSPNGDPDGSVGLGVDRDGDGIADLVVTQSRCQAQSGGGNECIELWTKRDKGMTRAWTTNLRNCF
jgi:hypothetical protein